jgi:hypothetical protein
VNSNEQIAEEIRKIAEQVKERNDLILEAKKEIRSLEREMEPLILSYHGIKVGDRILVEKSSWNAKRLGYDKYEVVYQVDGLYSAEWHSLKLDDAPWLVGCKIRKDGTPGKNQESITAKWRKLEEAQPLPAVGEKDEGSEP